MIADPPTEKSESSSSMIGKLPLSPNTNNALSDLSDNEKSSDKEPPTKKTMESNSLKCDCSVSYFCIMILFDDRFEPFFAINATLIGGPSLARNEKEGDAFLESSNWSIFAYCYCSMRCCG
jgi:hypothetical protein